jgi:hypothetical protein
MQTKQFFLKTLIWVVFLALFTACKKDDPEPIPLTLVSLKAGTIDLNGATAATNIPVGANIVAEFSTEVDDASKSAITLTRTTDNVNLVATITVTGKTVTIDPNEILGTGTPFTLRFGSALKSTAGLTLGSNTDRAFTSEGTFAAPGAFAHWTFEDNANDIIGTYDAASNQIVAVTYVAGRKAAAGKAASFNGTTSIIEISNGSGLMNNGSWALSLWVKPNSSLGKGHFVLGLGGANGFQFEIPGSYENCKLAASYAHTNPAGAGTTTEDLWVDASGNLGWQGWTFSKDYAGTFDDLIKDQWVHAVFVYNSTDKTGTAYINGERAKAQDFDNWPDGDNKRFVTGLQWQGALPTVANELAFGFIRSRNGTLFADTDWGDYAKPGANHFNGLLDDVIIYKKALTQTEITAMYNSGKP